MNAKSILDYNEIHQNENLRDGSANLHWDCRKR